jgi:hypothetical protein
VDRIVVSDLKDATFFATIHLTVKGEPVVVDARPSDAIALALRAKAPILVDSAVIDAAKASDIVPERDDSARLSKMAREPRHGGVRQVPDVVRADVGRPTSAPRRRFPGRRVGARRGDTDAASGASSCEPEGSEPRAARPSTALGPGRPWCRPWARSVAGSTLPWRRTRGVRPIIPLPTRTGRIRLPVRVPSSGTNVGRPTSDAVAVAGWRQGRSFSPTRRDQAPIGARWLRPGIGAGVIRDLPRVRLSADVLAIAGSSVRCAVR